MLITSASGQITLRIHDTSVSISHIILSLSLSLAFDFRRQFSRTVTMGPKVSQDLLFAIQSMCLGKEYGVVRSPFIHILFHVCSGRPRGFIPTTGCSYSPLQGFMPIDRFWFHQEHLRRCCQEPVLRTDVLARIQFSFRLVAKLIHETLGDRGARTAINRIIFSRKIITL